MANNVQYMNGKSLGIAATLPSLMGERFNAVERTADEHESAVLLMCERYENHQDLFSGEPLDVIGMEMDGEELDPNTETA